MLKLRAVPRTLGGMSGGRLVCLIVLAGLAVVSGLARSEALAQTADPQSLVGEWVGTWIRDSHVQSDYNMTITKVEGNQVHGRVERTGLGSTLAASFNFVGTLEGDKLVFSASGHTGELTIYRTRVGTTLQGTSFESARFNISMTKSK